MTLTFALRADIQVHKNGYDHGSGRVVYEVDVDGEGKYRCVAAQAFDQDGDRIEGTVDGVRLYPSRLERLRERLTSWEHEPEQEYEQVARVTEKMEAVIERLDDARARHDDCDLPK